MRTQLVPYTGAGGGVGAGVRVGTGVAAAASAGLKTTGVLFTSDAPAKNEGTGAPGGSPSAAPSVAAAAAAVFHPQSLALLDGTKRIL